MASRAIPQRELPPVSAFTGRRRVYNLAGASLDDISFPRPHTPRQLGPPEVGRHRSEPLPSRR